VHGVRIRCASRRTAAHNLLRLSAARPSVAPLVFEHSDNCRKPLGAWMRNVSAPVTLSARGLD